MSTTLTNGLKLPDKGSVDWYADMQNNYAILDGAVGTIAEHSTQISGKAPLVHTHVKSDVTDLFNSANTWSGSQTFTDTYIKNSDVTWGVEPSSARHRNLYFTDSTDTTIGYVRRRVTNGSQGIYVAGRAPVKNGQLDPTGDLITWGFSQIFLSDGSTYFQFDGNIGNSIVPRANNSYDLGSSSYQWKKIYSTDVVHTSGDETITGIKTLVDYWHLQAKNLKAGEGETYGRTGYSLVYTDKNDVTMGDVTLFKNANAARTFIRIKGGDYYTNGAPAAAGTLVQSTLMVGTNVSGKKIIECDSDIVYPTTNNATDLGTSTNKWKTINGINPGALSLPRIGTAADTDYIDVSGNIDLSVTSAQTFAAPATGWFCISFKYDKVTSCRISAFNLRGDCVPMGSDGYVGCYIPVTAGVTVTVRVNATAIYNARIYLCQGNV